MEKNMDNKATMPTGLKTSDITPAQTVEMREENTTIVLSVDANENTMLICSARLFLPKMGG